MVRSHRVAVAWKDLCPNTRLRAARKSKESGDDTESGDDWVLVSSVGNWSAWSRNIKVHWVMKPYTSLGLPMIAWREGQVSDTVRLLVTVATSDEGWLGWLLVGYLSLCISPTRRMCCSLSSFIVPCCCCTMIINWFITVFSSRIELWFLLVGSYFDV